MVASSLDSSWAFLVTLRPKSGFELPATMFSGLFDWPLSFCSLVSPTPYCKFAIHSVLLSSAGSFAGICMWITVLQLMVKELHFTKKIKKCGRLSGPNVVVRDPP